MTNLRSGSRGDARALPPIEQREMSEVLWEHTDEGVLAITLNRPERLNALNFRMLRELFAHRLVIDVAGHEEDRRIRRNCR